MDRDPGAWLVLNALAVARRLAAITAFMFFDGIEG